MALGNLNYLKYFYDAARTGSLVEAAKINHISPSAVSQGIRKLEQELGVELLLHQRNRFKISGEGENLLPRCKEILSHIDGLYRDISETANGLHGTVKIATSHSIGLTMFPDVLKKMKRQHPGLNIKLLFGTTSNVRQMVTSNVVDFAVIVDDGRWSPLEKITLRKGRFVCAVSKEWKPSEVSTQSFIITEERADVDVLKKSYYRSLKKELPVYAEVESWMVIARFAEAGLGIGFIPDFVLEGAKLKEPKMTVPNIPYALVAIYSKQGALSKSANAVLLALESVEAVAT